MRKRKGNPDYVPKEVWVERKGKSFLMTVYVRADKTEKDNKDEIDELFAKRIEEIKQKIIKEIFGLDDE